MKKARLERCDPGFEPCLQCAGVRRSLAKGGVRRLPSSYPDETTAAAHVVLPVDTRSNLGTDAEPWTGVHSLSQPAMRRLFDTRPSGEILLEARPGAQIQLPRISCARAGRRCTNAQESRTASSPSDRGIERGGHWREVGEHRVTWIAQGVETSSAAASKPAQAARAAPGDLPLARVL
jgi:hypothetical protein